MSKNAFVLRPRGINHGEDHHRAGSVIRNMSAGQFKDWSDAGMVREATAAEVAGTKPKAAAKPKPKAKPKVKAPPKPAATPTPPAVETTATT